MTFDLNFKSICMNAKLKSFFGYWLIPCLIFLIFDLIQIESFSKINFKAYLYIGLLMSIISFNLIFQLPKLEARIKIKWKSIVGILLLNFISTFIFSFFYTIFLFDTFLKDYDLNSFQINVYQSLFSCFILLIYLLISELWFKKELTFQFYYSLKTNVLLFSLSFLFLALIQFLLVKDIYKVFNSETYLEMILKDFFNMFCWTLIVHVLVVAFEKIKLKFTINIILVFFISFVLFFVTFLKTDFIHTRIISSIFFNFFFFFLVLGIFYFYKLIHNNRKLNIEKLIVSQEYLNLKNQINPHFLFNNLNTLIGFIEENPKKAIDFGHHLSSVYRYYLEVNKEDFIALEKEIEFISHYLNVNKAKFHENLNYTISLSDGLHGYILNHSLQEVIDNVFKHNIIDDQHSVHLEIKVQNDYLVIKNNKHIKDNVQSNHAGLNNIKKRYFLLTQKEVIVIQTDKYFEIHLPILTYEA